jgi:hypothetical protein
MSSVKDLPKTPHLVFDCKPCRLCVAMALTNEQAALFDDGDAFVEALSSEQRNAMGTIVFLHGKHGLAFVLAMPPNGGAAS